MLDSDSIFSWKPEKEDFLKQLTDPPSYYFREELFPKGIDNAHIDVLLSSQFVLVTQNLVQNLLQDEIEQRVHKDSSKTPRTVDMVSFNDAYVELMETALGMTRERSRPELIQLLQLSVLKFVLMTTDDELKQYRESMNEARGAQTSIQIVQQHDLLVTLSGEEPFIRFRLVERIFGLISKAEGSRLRKRRKSILGRSWPIPKQALFNPLLHITNLWSQEQMLGHYSLVTVERENTGLFSRINRIVCKQLTDYLPTWTRPQRVKAKDKPSTFTLRQDQGSLSGFVELELLLATSLKPAEYATGHYSWLDVPDNIDRLFKVSGSEGATHAQWQGFQQLLLKAFYRQFEQSNLLTSIIALSELTPVLEAYPRLLSMGQMMAFLSGEISRREVLKKISNPPKELEVMEFMQALEQVDSHVKQLKEDDKRRIVLKFLVEFCTFRRDLKLAYHTHWLMNKIRILTRKKDIELSRSNRSLNEFLLTDEMKSGGERIRNHVIVKADVRGSTHITAQLMARNLNPASYFSLNFFDPITELLDAFSATKVFVEGDAVILSLFEYEDAAHDWLAVSRACGLARRILAVVDAQNIQNRKYGLPNLELGLGIAFRDEPPAFLYDGDQQIMISSAINRADRLSSCSSELRRTGLGEQLKRGVEVVVPVDQSLLKKESEDQLQRFNVDGIELEPEAFAKLKTELALQKLKVTLANYSEHSVFYLGRFPDKNGKLHTLVIREAPVRLWIANDMSTEEQWGRYFYEVITNEQLIDELKKKARVYFSKTKKT